MSFRSLTVAIFTICMLAATARAQFATTTQSGAGDSAGGVGPQSAFSNVTTEFDGISVNIKRLLEDPAGDGTVRLIFTLENSSDKDRRLLFTGPRSTLIDELGTVYSAKNKTVGIESCVYRDKWSPDAAWCGRKYGKVATRLAPGVPVTVSIRFAPGEGYSEELAKMSQTVSLRSRLAHYSDDLKDSKTADIIVNNIPFPR